MYGSNTIKFTQCSLTFLSSRAVFRSRRLKEDPKSAKELPVVWPSREVVIVDQAQACARYVKDLLRDGEPSAIDAEGVNLCRSGELCLLQVAPRSGPIFMFDMCKLGQMAFSTGRLKESPSGVLEGV